MKHPGFAVALGTAITALAFLSLSRAQPSTNPVLSVAVTGGSAFELLWPRSFPDFVLEETESMGTASNWQQVPESKETRGNEFVIRLPLSLATRFFRLRQVATASKFRLLAHSPSDGAGEVGVTVRPKATFSESFNPATLTRESFFATAAGTKLEATIVPANDGSFAWLFFKDSMPGGTRVRVTVDGEGIRSASGSGLLDADGDGVPGGVASYEFTTVSTAAIPGTVLAGRVVDPGPDLQPRTLDDIGFGAGGIAFLNPIAGVKVHLIGLEDQATVTDDQGWFQFDAVPVGDVKVVLEGPTATTPHPGFYWPEMVMDTRTQPGMTNYVEMIGQEPGALPIFLQSLYLPRIASNVLQTVKADTTTLITLEPNAAYNLPPEQQKFLTVEVPPNSLIGDGGQKLESGQVGVSVVPPELVRDMLPPGVLQHTFDVTVQAPGLATFATPAPMTFPNVFNAAPGTKQNFLSFDHTTGRLVIEGTATVSADGLSVRTDPGTGITHPGWHGLTPPGGPNDPPCDPSAPHDFLVKPFPVTVGIKSYLAVRDGETFTLAFGNAAVKNKANEDPCSRENIRATPLVIDFTVEGPAAQFLDGLPSQIQLLPGQQHSFVIKARPLADPLTLQVAEQDSLFGIKLQINGHTLGLNDHLIDETIYIYRFVDVADANASDGILDFPDTLVDGRGGAVRVRPLTINAPSSATPKFEIVLGDDFLVSASPSGFVFDTRNEGLNRHPIRVLTPSGTLAGTIDLRGVGAPSTKLFIDKPGLKDLLRKIGERTTDTAPANSLHLSRSEVLILNSDLRREDLANLVEEKTLAKFQKFGPAVELSSFAGPDILSINWDTTNRFGLFGDSQPNDVGDGIDNEAAIKKVIGLRNTLNRSARSFALSKGINTNFGPTVKVYPENIFKWQYGVPLALSFEEMANALSKVTAHEAGHTIGLPHSAQAFRPSPPRETNDVQIVDLGQLGPLEAFRLEFDGEITEEVLSTASASVVEFALSVLPNIRANIKVIAGARAFTLEFIGDYRGVDVPEVVLHARPGSGANVFTFTQGSSPPEIKTRTNPLGTSGIEDIMTGGEIEIFDQLGFEPGFSFEILKLSLRTAWTLEEADAALNSYVLAAATVTVPGRTLFDGFLPDTGPGFRFDGPRLALIGPNGRLLDNIVDFGLIKSDGPNGARVSLNCQLLNFGDGDLLIRHVGVNDPHQSFAATQLAPNLVIPRGETSNVTLTFDPSASGELTAELSIDCDDPTFTLPVKLHGLGRSPEGDIRLLVPNNNLGGATLGGSIIKTNLGIIVNIGERPLTITSIATTAGQPQFRIQGLPDTFPAQPIVIPPNQTQTIDVAFTPGRVGLDRAAFEIISNDPDTAALKLSVVATGLAPSGDPLDSLSYGEDFVAMESPDFPAAAVLRAKTDGAGNFEFFLPPDQRYHTVIFDPISGLIAHLNGITASSGRNTSLGIPVFLPSTAPDSDGDGLPDDVEFTIGANPNKADTDGDGIEDFVSVSQGLDPLGGRALPVGIVGQLRLNAGTEQQSDAKKVIVIAPGGDLTNPIALVAAGQGGLAVIDVRQPTQPVLLNQLRLDGNALDVGADADLGIAVVAAGDAGLHLIDISNPASPRLIKSLCSWKAEHVEVVQGVAYVVGGLDTSGYSLVAFDLTAGQALQTIPLLGSPVGAMAHEGSTLYLMEKSGLNLLLMDISGRNMNLRNSIAVGAPYVRTPPQSLAVGNGIAYLTLSGGSAEVSGFAPGWGGYATVDVSDPDALKMIAGTAVPLGTQAPGQAMALNGSGVGVLTGPVYVGFRDIIPVLDVMDVSAPTNTYAVIRRVNLPSAPQEVMIHQGLAYVTCGTNGLVIVNYLPFDGEGRPPTVAISIGIADTDPAKAGRQVVEGSIVPVRAAVQDDVQVARVELLVNGQVVQTSAAFPFNLEAVAPPATGNDARFTIQIRATDTGGNIGLSEPMAMESMKDPRVFGVESIDPVNKHVVPTDYGVIDVAFTKPVLPENVTFENFSVLNSQGRRMNLRGLEWAEQGRLVRMRWDELPPDDYALVLRSASIRDFTGNALGAANLTNRFTTHTFTMRWTGAAGPTLIASGIRMPYSWNDPLNWCPARVPGSNDSVFINLPRTNTFTRQLFTTTTNIIVSWVGRLDRNNAAQPAELRCLVSNEEVSLHNVDLRVREFIQVNNYLDIAGSALRDTLVIDGTNNILRNYTPYLNPALTADGYRYLLDRVTLQGDFQVECTLFEVINLLTVQGNVRERKNQFGNICIGNFSIDRDTVIEGPGTLHDLGLLITIPSVGVDPFATQRLVTINTNVTFRGHFGMTIGTGSKLINRGRFLFDELTPSDQQTATSNPATYFSDIWLTGYTNSVDSYQTFINEGTIEVSNGYRLAINGSFDVFVNRGTLRVREGSRLLVRSSYISPRTICDAGGLCSFTFNSPFITAPGQVSELSGPGRWFSEDKEFRGGTVRLTDGAVMEGSAIFNDVTFEGELHNYDWTSSRRNEVLELLRGYSPEVQVVTNLTLNGLIHFHRKANENRGYLLFRPGQQRLQGNGRLEFEGSTFSSQIGQASLALENSRLLYLTIGSGISIHGSSLTIGSIAAINPAHTPPFVENFGTILTQPGDFLYLSTFGFTNSGVLHIASNTVVNASNNFAQTAAGRLEVDLAGTIPGTDHGQLKIGGNADLSGTFQVQPAASFQPKSGDSFQFLTYASVAGTFSNVAAPSLAGDLVYQPVYRTTNFTLQVGPSGGSGPVQGPGHALEFTLAAGGPMVPHNPQLNSFPLTITAWVKTGLPNGAYWPLVEKFVSNPPQGYALFLNNGRVSAFYYADSANYLSDLGAGLDQRFIADNQWHHVAYTIDSSGGKIYIDGVLANTHSWVGTAQPVQTTQFLRLGTARLPGQLDEVTLWQRALSQTEIEQSRNFLLQGNEAGLLGYWHFDEGRGEVASDASGHGFNAVVGFVGAAKWVESTAPVKSSP